MTTASAITAFNAKPKFFVLESFGEIRTSFCNLTDAYDFCADLQCDGDDLSRYVLNDQGHVMYSFPEKA